MSVKDYAAEEQEVGLYHGQVMSKDPGTQIHGFRLTPGTPYRKLTHHPTKRLFEIRLESRDSLRAEQLSKLLRVGDQLLL